METLQDRIERLEFYQRMLLSMISKEYPFYKLIIEKGLNEKEMGEVFALCDELEQKLEEQREDGFLLFTPLLIHFVGMLNDKLEPVDTIKSLYNQGLYKDLMIELYEMISKENGFY